MTANNPPRVRSCVRRVYLYWRNQGFAPEDARLMAEQYLAAIEKRYQR